MKKVLIISYFYPPAYFVGAQRTAAWAKYLHEFGYYPIIITRQWNAGQSDLVDQQESNSLEVEHHETHEIHRLPYKRSLRDKLSKYPLLKPLQKALTLKELILSNWIIKCLPFSNFYSHSKRILQDNSNIKIVIASGTPFQAFSIGHQLKKDFPSICWLPDYRDEWTSRVSEKSENILSRIIYALNVRSESKWTSNSSFFITVSETWNNNISSLINKEGVVITNGFDNDFFNKSRTSNDNQHLEILYLGSLYSYQDFTFLFQSILEINKASNTPCINLTFLGSFSNEQEFISLKRKVEVLSPFVRLLDKVSHEEVQDFIEQSDVLFLTEYINLEGCLPVKIFDYYNSSKPILLCPSDNDLMEKFIKETESGFIVNTKEECKAVLQNLLQKKQAGEELIGPRNTKNAYFYKRKYQTQLLAEALDNLLKIKK